ncbi:hypothetical protein [Methyloraptor flagellatus]|uniref:PD-(D/E)XK endonuclease-like domain-containing protein n=1 Tax=Methyloraptor flagellatus TaxID=3162530 RepID=A0AAU7XC01_9HYPH
MRSFDDRNEEAARLAAEVEAFGRDIAKARIAVADLRFHLAMRRVRADIARRYGPGPRPIERRFDPRQPRVPAGHPDGGQWSSTGGAGESAGTDAARTGGAGPGGAGTGYPATAWSGREGDGTVVPVQFNPLFRMPLLPPLLAPVPSKPRPPQNPEQILPPEQVQPSDRSRVPSFLRDNLDYLLENPELHLLDRDLANAFSTYDRLTKDYAGGPQPILTLEARPRAFNDPSDSLADVIGSSRTVGDEELKVLCPSYAEVQRVVSAVAADVDSRFVRLSPQDRGTKIHFEVANEFRANYPEYPVEQSFLQGDRFENRPLGSVATDVFAYGNDGTICIHDIKTGKADLSVPRMARLYRHARGYFPQGSRIIFSEVRP